MKNDYLLRLFIERGSEVLLKTETDRVARSILQNHKAKSKCNPNPILCGGNL